MMVAVLLMAAVPATPDRWIADVVAVGPVVVVAVVLSALGLALAGAPRRRRVRAVPAAPVRRELTSGRAR